MGEKRLIFGCGNNCEWCNHTNVDYTIDINPSINPSLEFDVQNLKLNSLCNIKDNTFDYVSFEGLSFHIDKKNILFIKNMKEEIERIRTKKSVIDIHFFLPGSYRNLKGRWDNKYFYETFISYDELIKMSENEIKYLLSYKSVFLDSDGYEKGNGFN